MNALMSIQTLPFSKDNKEDAIIEKVISHIKSKGYVYEVCVFETTIEGELTDLVKIIEEINTICVENGSDTVMSIIKILYNPNGMKTIAQKTEKYKMI